MTDKIKEISWNAIILIFFLLFFVLLWVYGTEKEDSNKEVNCYDNLGNLIEGVKCIEKNKGELNELGIGMVISFCIIVILISFLIHYNWIFKNESSNLL